MKRFILVIIILLSCCGCNSQYSVTQWALNNDGSYINGKKGICDIDIDYIDFSSKIVSVPKIAIIDSGFNYKDVRLKNSLLDIKNYYEEKEHDDKYKYAYNGWNFKKDAPIEITDIENSHGTYIAGIIASSSQNYRGINPNAKLLNIIIDDTNCYSLVEAIKYAENLGVQIVNCSFCINEDYKEIYDVIKESKMLFICAAGNDYKNDCYYPAKYDLDNVISVATINNNGFISSYSNYGMLVDIAAPGENICVFDLNGKYTMANGSSIATAYVTGVASAICSCLPYFEATKIKEHILNNVKTLNSLNDTIKTGGIVSLKECIENIAQLNCCYKCS